MYETDRVPEGWVDKINKMDEIWVPTQFHVETFANSGVDKGKLVVIPESVDVDFFNPAATQRYQYPKEFQNHYKFLSIFK